MVILCEGAVDRHNAPIRPHHIQAILEKVGLDARITTLGHIQRGGAPSAFDRYMATLQGVEAVKALIESDARTATSIVIGIKENRVIRLPLMECVQSTQAIALKMQNLDFAGALQLRGPDFRANYSLVKKFYQLEEMKAHGGFPASKPLRIAIINCGAPCCGINAANRAIILYCLFKGYTPVGVFNGFSGLLKGDLREISLHDGPFHADKGGSFLGINRTLPSEDLGLTAFYLQAKQIDGLIIIGGFESYTSQLCLINARGQYPAFDIPIVCLPATVSNNVPGTDYSVGCDTALNIIVQSADSLRQSASSSRKRVFVVDVQGGNCGFLASMGGLAGGATQSYIPEEGLNLRALSQDIEHLKSRFNEDMQQGRIVLRNESVSSIYSAELVAKIYESESAGLFDARWAALGHLQQGSTPSPLDRIRATRLGVLCVAFIEATIFGLASKDDEDFFDWHPAAGSGGRNPRMTMDDSSAVVIGIRGPSVVFTCARRLLAETDTILRRPLDQWWREYRPLATILAKHSCPASDSTGSDKRALPE